MAEEHIRNPIDRVSPADIQASASRQEATMTVPRAEKAEPETKDSLREIVETVVFVIVLVLLLKTFVAEAFVIPTGSMAPTLFGHHHKVECPECKFQFTVNASGEVDDQEFPRHRVDECECQNCQYLIRGEEFLRAIGKSP